MEFRFPLFVKKRGERRTASDSVGRWGELVFYLFFFLIGGLLLTWHLAANILPDWRAMSDRSGLRPATCRLLDKRVAAREFVLPTVKGTDYRGELLLAVVDPPSEAEPVWAYDGTGEYSPNRDDAERTLTQYEIGNTFSCWIDPADPSRILLGRSYRWWPWLVVLIPTSLMVVGAIGAIRTLRQWNASTEWQAVSQQKSSFDMRTMQSASRPQLDAVPSVSRVVDSPGIRLAYRLPIDGSPNWRLAAMGTVCLVWNLLVLFFLEELFTQLSKGTVNWIIAGLVLPFAIIGIWLIVLFIRDAWNVVGIGTTQIEIASHPLYPGSECKLVLMQSGQMTVRELTVWLLCEERAVFQEGTDTREWIETVHREIVFRERNLRIDRAQPFETDFSVQIPANAMHSFQSNHNEVRWSLEVRGTTLRWPEFQRRFPIYVYPGGGIPNGEPTLPMLPNEEAAEA